jgi:hypothetical protein
MKAVEEADGRTRGGCREKEGKAETLENEILKRRGSPEAGI